MNSSAMNTSENTEEETDDPKQAYERHIQMKYTCLVVWPKCMNSN